MGEAVAMMRVVIQQPALPLYRIPFFRSLAQDPELSVEVIHGNLPGLSNATADGFRAAYVQSRWLRLGSRSLRWHAGHVLAVDPRRADVAVLNWDANYLSLPVALMRRRRAPTVLWGHGYSKAERFVRRAVRERIGAMADCILLYNSRAAEALIRRGWDPSRVFVAPNALDQSTVNRESERWRRDQGALVRFRDHAGLSGRRVILFVSRLLRENRVDVLVRAAGLLEERVPGLLVAIVGSGEAEPDLRELTRNLGLERVVRFVGPLYDEESLAPWFLTAEVFCYPANVGLSLLHAFGYGLPAVVGDDVSSHNPEIEALQPGKNGLAFRHADPASLADTLQVLLSNPSLRTSMSREALQTVQSRFSMDAMVAGFKAAIEFARGARL